MNKKYICHTILLKNNHLKFHINIHKILKLPQCDNKINQMNFAQNQLKFNNNKIHQNLKLCKLNLKFQYKTHT